MSHTAVNKPIRVSESPRLLHPLGEVYSAEGVVLPHARQVHPRDIPRPQRDLLVHQRDMTPTLEAHYRQDMRLRLLARQLLGDVLVREVVLVGRETGAPAEFGAIRIHLRHLAGEARELVLACEVPLGRILQDHDVPHSSRPKLYFAIRSDETICQAFGIDGPHTLYGRQNVLLTPEEQVLAEVLEILPPAESAQPIAAKEGDAP